MKTTKFCTMYSYKGGAGRTVATVNIASILAKKYKKEVVCIDMDLDGGGLAVVFNVHSEVNDPVKRETDQRRCIQDIFFIGADEEDIPVPVVYKDISSDNDFTENWWGKMVFDLGEDKKKGIEGKLYFIPASFGTDVVDSAAGDDFAACLTKFINPLIKVIQPDIVLFDSSSGFQDYTTMLLPRSNLLVMFFRWSLQSIEGTIEASKFILPTYPKLKMLLVPSAVPRSSLNKTEYYDFHASGKSRIENEIVFSKLNNKGNVQFFSEGIGESSLLKWKEEIFIFNEKNLGEEEREILNDYDEVAKQILKTLNM